MDNQQSKKCCDTCKHYHWYYDKCDKYDCEVDARSVCAGYLIDADKLLYDLYKRDYDVEWILNVQKGDKE